jgi:hypothetical protein
MTKSIWLAGALALAACGGNGVTKPSLDDNAQVSSLTEVQAAELCMYCYEEIGGPRVIQCAGSDTITIPDPSACDGSGSNAVDSSAAFGSGVGSGCTMTVEQMEACFQALSGSPTALCEDVGGTPLPSACLPLLGCSEAGQDSTAPTLRGRLGENGLRQ